MEEKSSSVNWASVMIRKKLVPKGRGTIMRCDLVGVGIVFYEETCHSRGRIWGLIYVQAMSNILEYFLLPA